MDQSGLYICIICSSYYSKNCNDLIFIEIGTGSIASYIKCIGKVFKIFFDYYSKYIITGSHDGILSCNYDKIQPTAHGCGYFGDNPESHNVADHLRKADEHNAYTDA